MRSRGADLTPAVRAGAAAAARIARPARRLAHRGAVWRPVPSFDFRCSLGTTRPRFPLPSRPVSGSHARVGIASSSVGSSIPLGRVGSRVPLASRRAGYFLLLAQEKVTKEKGTPMPRSPGILPCDCAGRLRGFADSASLRWQRTGRHPAGHPAGLSCACPPRHRGPDQRASCALKPTPASLCSCLKWAPCGAPRSRADQRGKANCLRPGMAELFAGRWAASTAGNRSGNARSARMPGSPFLWLLSFGESKESDPLAARRAEPSVHHSQERAKSQRCDFAGTVLTGIRAASRTEPSSATRNERSIVAEPWKSLERNAATGGPRA